MRIAPRNRERAVFSTYAGHPPEAGKSCRAIVAAGSLVVQRCFALHSVRAVCEFVSWQRGDAIIADHNHQLGSTLFYLGDYAAAWTHLEQGITLIDPAAGWAQARRHGVAYEVNALIGFQGLM